MSIAKPTGEYADQMLEPDGWVEVDEQSLHDRAQVLTTTLRQVTSALEGFQHEETEIFGGGVWSGGGANSAKGKLGEVVKDLQGVQNDLVKAITWYQKAADTVTQTKTAIADRVEKAQSKIADLKGDTNSDADDRQNAIDALVKQVHGTNVSDVTNAAGKLPTSASWNSPPGALKNLLDQKAPPGPAAGGPGRGGAGAQQVGNNGGPGGPSAGGPGGPGRGGAGAQQAGNNGGPGGQAAGGSGGPGRGGANAAVAGNGDQGLEPGPYFPQEPAAYNGNSPNWSVPSFSGLSGGGGGHGGGGGGQWGSMLSGLGGSQGGQNNPTGDMFDHHMWDGLQRPDAGLQQTLAQTAMNNAAASAAASAAAQVPLAASADATQVNPAAARGPAVTDATVTSAGAATASGGSSGASAGISAIGAAPTGSSDGGAAGSSMPLLPPATPHPAAPVSATGGGGTGGTATAGSGGPGVHPASTTSVGRPGFGGSVTSSQAEAAPAPIPVSSARAQKDAIAQATHRQSGGGDVQVAYRLAAAFNAEDVVNKADFRFFWMTAVTADGQIVVANSYGLAFIPDGVNLPAQVIMASADDTVPVEERARWATYPNLALQGWAAHHGTTLRMMIAKREHFAGIDPGVPTRFVADEDIPASGKMQGRSRLEVIDPAEATRLAALSDLGLVELLPPAPVDASPPADQRTTLWFDLMKHLMSSDAERGVAHLQSFATYATHAQELALHRAHSAVHAVEQRDAVADWLYWQRIAELLDEALASAAR
jgi:hypothetical protein